MPFRLAADAVLLLHLAFILFAALGALLAARWRWIPWLQLPAAAWSVFIELMAGICPLTHLENFLRRQAGQAGYSESFIEHYLLAVIYPGGLTRTGQVVLAALVVALNAALYLRLWRRR